MIDSVSLAPTRRSAVRRAVQLDCAVHNALWDGPAFYRATDLSPGGLWLHADLALEVGEEVVLGFRPPRWPEWAGPVTAVGKVVRVSLPRRRGDRQPAGMGVRFTHVEPEAAAWMDHCLRGLPPPLPRRSKAEPVDRAAPQALALDDGTALAFVAEAPLLTAGRPRGTPVPGARRKKRNRARAERSGRARTSERTARRTRKAAARKPALRLVG